MRRVGEGRVIMSGPFQHPEPSMHRRHFLAALAAQSTPAAHGAEPIWSRLQSGRNVILMRHAATVPGIGDPPGFKLGECSTQRNLSDAGRAQAGRIGAAFRQHRIPLGSVLSSRWCRCIDTAQLAFGRVEPVAMLDSMFNDDDVARRRKRDALRAYLAQRKEAGNLVLVTHDVNIRALVGQYAEQGAFLVATNSPDGELVILSSVIDLR